MWEQRYTTARDIFLKNVDHIFSEDSDLLSQVRKSILEAHLIANREAVLYSLERYIEAELDFAGVGDRGIGRLSTEIPRYGAYFRKRLSQLAPSELEILRQQIIDTVIAGYFSHVVAAEDPVLQPTVSSSNQLFSEWIPIVYSAALPNSFSREIMHNVNGLLGHALTKHKAMLYVMKIRGGGWFRRDLTDEVIYYHGIAGFGLRAIEVRRRPAVA
jgi:hypothetical protein